MTKQELINIYCCLEKYVLEGRTTFFILQYLDRLICDLNDCSDSTTTTTTTTSTTTIAMTTLPSTTVEEGCVIPSVSYFTVCQTNIPGIGGVTNGLFRVYLIFDSTNSDPYSVAYTITNSYNAEEKNVTMFSSQITALETDFPNGEVFDIYIERDDTPGCILTISNVTNQINCPDLTRTTTVPTTIPVPEWNLRVKTRNMFGYGDLAAFEAFLLSKGNVGVSVTDSNAAGFDYYYLVTGITGFVDGTFEGETNLKEIVDLTGWATGVLGERCFRGCNGLNQVKFDSIDEVKNQCFENTLSALDLSIKGANKIGANVGNNSVFNNTSTSVVVKVKTVHQTSNAGSPDGDLQYVTGIGGSVSYF